MSKLELLTPQDSAIVLIDYQPAMYQGVPEAKGTAVQMTMPFDAGLDDRERKFYAMPQPALPAKDHHGSAAIYQQPDKSS